MVLVNTGDHTLKILPGAVIAQIIIMKYIRITWDEDCFSVCKNEHSLADEFGINLSLNLSKEVQSREDKDENTLHKLRISLANFDSLGRINKAKNVLQELLVKHKIPLPKYEYDFIGPSNDRTFKGTVTVRYSPTDTMIVTGDEEYTKKNADKSAALNALKKLKGV